MRLGVLGFFGNYIRQIREGARHGGNGRINFLQRLLKRLRNLLVQVALDLLLQLRQEVVLDFVLDLGLNVLLDLVLELLLDFRVQGVEPGGGLLLV